MTRSKGEGLDPRYAEGRKKYIMERVEDSKVGMRRAWKEWYSGERVIEVRDGRQTSKG